MRKLDEDSIVRYHNSTRICGGVVFGVSGVACVRCFSFWCDFSLFLVLSRVPVGHRLVCSFSLCILFYSRECFFPFRFVYIYLPLEKTIQPASDNAWIFVGC